MNGLDLFRSPKTAADEIADIVSAQCPPVVPENCDAFSCRECWLAWLTTGEPPKEKGPSDKQTAPGRDSAPYYPPTEAIRKAAERLKDGNMEYTAISGQDEDLGQQTGSFAEKYTVTDVEGDNVVVTEFVDDKQIRSYQATLGQEETIELSRENWLVLANGDHQLRVEAVDGNFATSVRVWNFSKKETVIAFQFAQPEETDARATKILITPTWHIEGSVAKVEACNNAFDDSQAWEDITAQVAINRVYNFLNESKTAEKWGVNVRFTITKNEGYEEEVSISGFGGAYE